MYNTLRGFGITICFALAVLFATLSTASAQQKDTVTFVGVGSGAATYDISYYNGTAIETEDAYTGEYELSVNGGPVKNVFCTDLFDNVYIPETWSAIQGQTSDAVYGLPSATPPTGSYPVGPDNINAIDYIAQNYASSSIPASENAAAQLAVWDLVIGGQVSKTGSTYSWAGDTIPTGPNAGATVFSANASQATLAEVYTIEQAALSAKGAQGSQWLDSIYGTQSSTGRPQDFAFATPEPATIAAFMILAFSIGGLILRRKRQGSNMQLAA